MGLVHMYFIEDVNYRLLMHHYVSHIMLSGNNYNVMLDFRFSLVNFVVFSPANGGG